MKRILLIVMALIWLVPAAAMAHSKLESAIPAQEATVEASPEQITMVFNTKIEKLSNFKLFNEAGEQIETAKAEVNGDTMMGKVTSPLENGAYTVKWTIIGADGHSVEGEYGFKVDAAIEASPSPSPETEHSETPKSEATSPAATAEPTVTPTDSTESEETNHNTSYTPYVVIGGIILLAAVLLALLRRRK